MKKIDLSEVDWAEVAWVLVAFALGMFLASAARKGRDMDKAIEKLAQARNIEAKCKDEVDQTTIELKKIGVWKRLRRQLKHMKTAQANVAKAEKEVRRQARIAYQENNERPHPAITVREATEADRNWGMAGHVGYPLVSIALDLSEYLPED